MATPDDPGCPAISRIARRSSPIKHLISDNPYPSPVDPQPLPDYPPTDPPIDPSPVTPTDPPTINPFPVEPVPTDPGDTGQPPEVPPAQTPCDRYTQMWEGAVTTERGALSNLKLAKANGLIVKSDYERIMADPNSTQIQKDAAEKALAGATNAYNQAFSLMTQAQNTVNADAYNAEIACGHPFVDPNFKKEGTAQKISIGDDNYIYDTGDGG